MRKERVLRDQGDEMAWFTILKMLDVRELNINRHSNSKFEEVGQTFGGSLLTNDRSDETSVAQPMR